MKFFGSKNPPDSEAVFQQAIQIFQQGDPVEALTMMKQCVGHVRDAAGADSLPHVKALSQLASLYCGAGEFEQGARLCSEAAQHCPNDEAGTKEKLTQLMNAGQMLAQCGKADEAVPILEQALRERTAFYGEGHAGVAYGEQVLAEAMLANQQFDEGLEHANNATQTFYELGHHEFPETYAMRSALATAAGIEPESIWEDLAELPEEVVVEVAGHSNRMAQLMEPDAGGTYLGQLATWCEQHKSANIVLRANTVAAWSNFSQMTDNAEGMGRSSDMVLGFLDQLPQAEDRINMLQGVALNYSRCGRSTDDIRAIYERATQTAAGLLEEEAGVARNWAIFEADQNNPDAANPLYDKAIELAQQAGSEELTGRSMIAKGIFLQHRKQSDEALFLLKRGTELLPPTSADAACGIMHLVALENGLPCCRDTGEEMHKESFSILARKFFEHSGLGDLLDHVGVGDNGLEISLGREPTEAELERLQLTHSMFISQLGNF